MQPPLPVRAFARLRCWPGPCAEGYGAASAGSKRRRRPSHIARQVRRRLVAGGGEHVCWADSPATHGRAGDGRTVTMSLSPPSGRARDDALLPGEFETGAVVRTALQARSLLVLAIEHV